MRRALLATLGVVAVALGVLAWLGTRQPTLRRSIDIQATPERVWAVLTDFGAYADWNPTIVRAEGSAAVGERLRIREAGGMSFEPEVLVANPGEELRWRGHVLVPGLVDGEHWFVIQELGPGRVRLTQAERFSGLAAVAARLTYDSTLQGYEDMNRALAARAERT